MLVAHGAVTSRYYGTSEELLGKYAWYTGVSRDLWLRPVGNMKPNDLGLFDMLGNVWQWTDSANAPHVAGPDKEEHRAKPGVEKDERRMIRGGSFVYAAWNERCATRHAYKVVNNDNNVGFRLARTFR